MNEKIVQRKHESQMNASELKTIEQAVRETVNYLGYTVKEHATERMDGKWATRYTNRGERPVTPQDIKNALLKGRPVEVNNTNGEKRVLLRAEDDKDAAIVVFSLTNREVVTAWVNAASDNHATLNMSNYTGNKFWNEDMRRVFAG